jgi:hypothetical protein
VNPEPASTENTDQRGFHHLGCVRSSRIIRQKQPLGVVFTKTPRRQSMGEVMIYHVPWTNSVFSHVPSGQSRPAHKIRIKLLERVSIFSVGHNHDEVINGQSNMAKAFSHRRNIPSPSSVPRAEAFSLAEKLQPALIIHDGDASIATEI